MTFCLWKKQASYVKKEGLKRETGRENGSINPKTAWLY